MTEEPELSLEDFMELPEAPPVSAGATDHKEASVARHLLEFAKSVGYKPFKISAWLKKAKEDELFKEIIDRNVVDSVDKAVTRYQSMELVDSYMKTESNGIAAVKYYIKAPVLTALRNITRAEQIYFQRRGEVIYITPLAAFPEAKTPKAKKFLKTLEFNRKFMYETKDRAALF